MSMHAGQPSRDRMRRLLAGRLARAGLPALAGLLLASACLPGGAPSTAAAGPGKPNVVFVLTDDLASNLVQYMPHVQQMEKQGTTFTNYDVTDSLCCPSRSSIFTGKFPHDTGIFTNGGSDGGFDAFHQRGDERDTFATQLQAAGYQTAMMGKYLNGYQPRQTLGGSGPYVPPGWNEWDVAGNGYPEFNYNLNENGKVVHHGNRPQDYLTDVLSGKGTSFIDRSASARKPFLLEVATFAPHAPYTPAPRDANAFPGLSAPQPPAFDQQDSVGEPPWLAGLPPLTAAETQSINTDFRKRAQAVQAVDQMLGRLEQELTAKGVAKNTYVVFSSDNGYHMGDHRLRPGKMTAFDTDIKVPLVATGPAVPSGRSAGQLSQNIDLAPTFEQLAGARVPDAVDGHSLAPLLAGQGPGDWRNANLVEHHGPDRDQTDPDLPARNSGNPPSYEAIRTPNSVYVEYADGEREYYDTASDPYELRNLASQLPPAQAQSLHDTLAAGESCHGGSSCWAAQHQRS
jgi:arylsulfatase A-like enzyme